MTDLRADLLNPAKLLAMFKAKGLDGILAVCHKFSDDPAVRLIESALTMSAAQLKDHPDALPMLLYARLHSHIDNPDIATLRQALRPYLDFIPVQEPTHFQAGGPVLTRWKGHTQGVSGALVTSGNKVLSWSHDNTLRLWSLTGETLAILVGHEAEVEGAVSLPDGRMMSWARNRTVCFWSSEGNLERKITEKSVEAALALPNGHLLVGCWVKGMGSQAIEEWSSDGTVLRQWEVSFWRSNGIHFTGIAVMPDGRVLSWGNEQPFRLWSSDGQLLKRLDDDTKTEFVHIRSDGSLLSDSGRIICLWDLDGNLLAKNNKIPLDYDFGTIWLEDGRILTWDYLTWHLLSPNFELLAQMRRHEQLRPGGGSHIPPGAIQLPDGKIVTWSYDDLTVLWSNQGEFLMILDTDFDPPMLALPDGSLLSASLYHWSSLQNVVKNPEIHTNFFRLLPLNDGRVASWSYTGNVWIWSTDGVLQTYIEGNGDAKEGVFIFTNGDILTYASNSSDLTVWSPQAEELTITPRLQYGARDILMLPDDRFLLLWDRLYLWSVDGIPLGVWDWFTEEKHTYIRKAHLLSDGRVFSWASDNTIQLWSLDGELLTLIKINERIIDDVDVLPDGRIWASVNRLVQTDKGDYTYNNKLLLWSSNGELLPTFFEGDGRVNDIKPMPDGRISAQFSTGILRLFTSDVEIQIEMTLSRIWNVYILMAGHIIGESLDNIVHLWSSEGILLDVENRKILSDPQNLHPWAKKHQLDWSDLLTVLKTNYPYEVLAETPRFFDYKGNVLTLYDMNTAQPIKRFFTDSPITNIVLLANETRLAIGCENGQVIFLDLPTPT